MNNKDNSRESQNDLSRAVFNLNLIWRLFWDMRVRFFDKLALLAAFLYLLSPIDLIPEAILGIFGYAEDIALLIGTFNYFLKSAQKHSPLVYWKHYYALKD